MSPKKLIKSFEHALVGLLRAFRSEQNFRIQVYLGIIVMVLAVYLQVQWWQLVTLISSVLFLMILELINTVVEKMVDVIKPRVHHYAGVMKDLMAGAVLLASVLVAIIVIFIFWEYF